MLDLPLIPLFCRTIDIDIFPCQFFSPDSFAFTDETSGSRFAPLVYTPDANCRGQKVEGNKKKREKREKKKKKRKEGRKKNGRRRTEETSKVLASLLGKHNTPVNSWFFMFVNLTRLSEGNLPETYLRSPAFSLLLKEPERGKKNTFIISLEIFLPNW